VRPFVVYITDKAETNMVTKNHFEEISKLISLVDGFKTEGSKQVSDYCLKVMGACLFDSTNPLF